MKPPISIVIFFLVIMDAAASATAAPKKLDLVIYWGQDRQEGTLRTACATGRYSFIIVVSTNLGSNRIPKLNFAGHNPTNNTYNMRDNIRFCQKLGIIVMLAIRSDSLSSIDDAKIFARHLWNNFLGGWSEFRPFGDAVLDGIYFMTPQYLPYQHNLAIFLSNYSNTSSSSGKLYLGAAHPCPPPGSTPMRGVIDFVSFESYSTTNSRQCDYNGNISEFMTAMNPAAKIYLDLSDERKCISPDVREILTELAKLPNVAGVIFPSKSCDDKNGYTDQITSLHD